MPISAIGIATGVLLILVGVGGYFAGGMASVTALIPAFAGLPILIFSAIAANPARKALGMHVAVVFGLLGFLAPLGRIIPVAIKGEFTLSLATGSMILMALICGAFTALCVMSFIQARRQRRLEEG
jgi:sulfite exporter TauE/SafE